MESLEKIMPTAKWALAIVPLGIAIGALFSDRPEPKEPPAQWWQLTGRDDVAIVPGDRVFVEAGPVDLSVPAGYRPDLDYDAEVWALPIPDYEFAAAPADAPVDDWPAVTYGIEVAENAADHADAAAHEALDAAAAAEPASERVPGAVPPEARKPELAMAGLY